MYYGTSRIIDILTFLSYTMIMDLPLNKAEFFEVVDATNKEHYDWNKREFKHNIYLKLKEVYDGLS